MAEEIAYIVKGFPRLSETFISNEVLLLEKSGAKIKLFSIKRPDEQLKQNTVSRIKAPIIYLPTMTSLSNSFLPTWLLVNMPGFFKAHLQLVASRPIGFIKTLFKAIAMTMVYRGLVNLALHFERKNQEKGSYQELVLG